MSCLSPPQGDVCTELGKLDSSNCLHFPESILRHRPSLKPEPPIRSIVSNLTIQQILHKELGWQCASTKIRDTRLVTLSTLIEEFLRLKQELFPMSSKKVLINFCIFPDFPQIFPMHKLLTWKMAREKLWYFHTYKPLL